MSLISFTLGAVYGQRPDTEGVSANDIIDSSADDFFAEQQQIDSSLMVVDSTDLVIAVDSTATDTTQVKQFLDDVMSGKNQDSLIYDLKTNLVTIYEKGDITYQNLNIKADYMQVDMVTKEIFAYGREDTLTNTSTRPEFLEGTSLYTMDTLTYNMDSKKARIKGVSTQDGDGILNGISVKKMPDNTINIAHGRYTTCNADHPHFYIAMSKAKMIPDEKVIVGPSYMVFEDVPLYFLGVPFGFFPIQDDRSSGFIIPEYGEETVKGFFIRDGGYYYAINDYIDVTVTGGYYTLGSWETSLQSSYSKRYRYSGSFSTTYANTITGEEGSADYVNANTFNVKWSHQQDAKFKPNSTFAASVNFSSSGYSKYGSTTLEDYLNTQTSSSISYSKKWDDSPFSLSTSLQHSQNSSDSTVSLTLPSATLSMSKIYPFQRKNVVGEQRWYEKISLSYTANMSNTVTVQEDELFTQTMYDNMSSGVSHSIPVSTSFNMLNYISVTPSLSYTERWYVKKVDQEWDSENAEIVYDTINGFYRVYNYSLSTSASTTVYGMYTMKNPDSWLKAVRHTITPTIGVSYTPDFGASKYGYYEQVQTSEDGDMSYYSPFSSSKYGVPSMGASAALSFSLQNTLEMKVRNERDTSGMKKISLIDNFSLSGSYNFIADSLNLSTISMNFRTTLTSDISLNVSATLDPYQVNSSGTRINEFMWSEGKIGRISSASTSFSYSFNSKASSSSDSRPSMNDINTQSAVKPLDMSDEYYNSLSDSERRQLYSSSYYDFSIPWNLGLSYSFSYSNSGISESVTQSLSFNGSVNLTSKWGITFNAGYDLEMSTLTPGTFTLSRDLHCWQMSFSWIPTGYRQSWSFSISAKSSLLQDLKYDKSQSYYDNLYSY